MIMISSPAGVQMAKAGKALELAKKKREGFTVETSEDLSRKQRLTAEVVTLQCAFNDASAVVLAELYEQNLHDMTGPD